MNKDFKMGEAKAYKAPETVTVELMGGPCMDVASPNGGIQNLITNDLIDDEGV